MTLEEAKKVAEIIQTADSGCSTCVEALVSQLSKAFPDFKWDSEFWCEDFKKSFNGSLVTVSKR